jgi:hypothetical protein
MNEAAIRERIRELNEMAMASPLVQADRSAGSQGAYETERPTSERCTADSLDLLRLQLKYLLFDLEATRRENRYLRQMLESRDRRDPEGGGEKDPKW